MDPSAGTGESVVGADLVLGWVDSSTGAAVVQDRWTDAHSMPKKDMCQDWAVLGGEQSVAAVGAGAPTAGVTSIEVKRALRVGNAQDRDIPAGPVSIVAAFGLGAYGLGDDFSSGDGSRRREAALVTFHDGEASAPFGAAGANFGAETRRPQECPVAHRGGHASLQERNFDILFERDIWEWLKDEASPHSDPQHESGFWMPDAKTAFNNMKQYSLEVPTMRRIEEFDSESSYLWYKIQDRQTEAGPPEQTRDAMPPGFGLDFEKIDQVTAWIEGGAPFNADEPTCSDGVFNGDETDVDQGGACVVETVDPPGGGGNEPYLAPQISLAIVGGVAALTIVVFGCAGACWTRRKAQTLQRDGHQMVAMTAI